MSLMTRVHSVENFVGIVDGSAWLYLSSYEEDDYFCVLAGCSVMCGFAVLRLCAEPLLKQFARPLAAGGESGRSDLSLIDPEAGKQVATVPVDGVTGHEVAASPDGKTAYVPIYGDSGVGRPGTDGSRSL